MIRENNINTKDINHIKDTKEEEDSFDSSYEITTWDDIDMNENILRGIYAYGFENPSPIQKKAIKPILMKKDVIAQAQSGTGKTAAFAIGALARVTLTEKTTQVLILSPTRELTTQTANVITSIGSSMVGLQVQKCFGGANIEEYNNDFAVQITPHIICGCPGRVYDMLRRNKINPKYMKLIILDEADEMLSSGFKEQVYNIFQYLNPTVQVALFSATLPNHILPIIQKIMRDPVKISVKTEQLTLEGISQFYAALEDDKQKYVTLKDLFSIISISQCIIYCNSIKRVMDLYDAMNEDGFPVCCIHSNMEKAARDLAFTEFKNGKSRVLISSNVTARGIDIQQVSTVINFDIPKDVHTYLHRIGRSGRWGRKGVGINFITKRDIGKMKEIESYYNCQIQELPCNLDFIKNI